VFFVNFRRLLDLTGPEDRRQQFADVWSRTTGGSSGGVAYLIKPHDLAWPAALLADA
jgi:hypothetical protein